MQIANAALSAQILPEAGGGLAGFDWHGRGTPIDLMRRYEADPQAEAIDPNRLACYPLVPWSNRIADGGFAVDGRWIALARNRPEEACPIHGSGWQRAWHVQAQSADAVQLSLHETSEAAYCYLATMRYALHDQSLQVDLTVTNTSTAAMPFGLGLHPFFPRHGHTSLHAPAPQVWLNDGRTPLPTESVEVPAEWDFRQQRALPPEGLDHAFRGWNGEASIRWPDVQLGLRIQAEADAFVLYTPKDRGFFCFEPVDHPINAVHLPGGAQAHGMTLLLPGAVLRRRFVFSVLDLAQAQPRM
nr:aldose 1-epimerase [Dyella acidiphila]